MYSYIYRATQFIHNARLQLYIIYFHDVPIQFHVASYFFL